MKRGEVAHGVTRGAFYLGIEKGLAILSGIAYFALLLRWLGPTKYGIMTLALSFVGLASMFTGNLENYLERFAAEFEAHGRLRTLRRAHLIVTGVKLGLGAVSALALIAVAPLLGQQFDMPELAALVPILSMIVLIDGFSSAGRATLFGIQQFRWMSGVAVGFHVVKTVMVGLLWWFQKGLFELAIGLSVLAVLQGLVSAAIPLWMLRRATDPDPSTSMGSRALLRSMVSYCLPLLGARITFMSGQNLSKIVLGKLFDPTLLGYFSFAYQTVERFVEVVYALPSSLLPMFTRLTARGERERLHHALDQALRLIQVVALALSATLVIGARELTLIVGSPLFEPAIPLLQVLALVPMVRTAQQPLTMLFQALRLPGVVLGLALLKFATEFGCYFALVPSLGLVGAGWANLAGAAVSYLAAMIVLKRHVPAGASDRTRTALLSFALFVPLVLAGLALATRLPHVWSVAGRLALIPCAVAAVFTLGLVREADFDRLLSFPLQSTWMARVREVLVRGARRTAQTLAPRRLS